jgi:hypothetical protein
MFAKKVAAVVFLAAILLLSISAAAFAQEPPENRPPENRPPPKEVPTPPPDCDVNITLLEGCEVQDVAVVAP